MNLNDGQHDALVELLNIGFGRAGASLSKLTGQRVLLEVPHVAIHPVDAARRVARPARQRRGRQRAPGLHRARWPATRCSSSIRWRAATLKELLTDEPALPLELDASSREVLTEVGNILLNACIGTFGNLLRVPVVFSVPDIDVASAPA